MVWCIVPRERSASGGCGGRGSRWQFEFGSKLGEFYAGTYAGVADTSAAPIIRHAKSMAATRITKN